MHKVRSALLAVAAVGLGSLSAAAGSSAHARDLPAPREVTVRVTPSGVKAPEVLPSGRYRLAVRAPRRTPALLQLVKPDRGYTRADLRADVRRGGPKADRRIQAHLRFFGGAEVRAGRTGVLWETLYAGRYWLMGVTMGPGGGSIHTIRVHGAPSPSRFPRVAAEATGTDDGLRLSRTAPERGRMLIRNTSADLDALVLMPLTKGTTYADFVHWLRHPEGDMPVRLRGIRSTSLLSPDAGYVLRYRLRPGDYVVMSLGSLFTSGPGSTVRDLFHPLTVSSAARSRLARAVTARTTEGFERAPALAPRLGRWLSDPHREPEQLARGLAESLTGSAAGDR